MKLNKEKIKTAQQYNEYKKAVFRLSNILGDLMEIPDSVFKYKQDDKWKQIHKKKKKKRKMTKNLSKYLKKKKKKGVKYEHKADSE